MGNQGVYRDGLCLSNVLFFYRCATVLRYSLSSNAISFDGHERISSKSVCTKDGFIFLKGEYESLRIVSFRRFHKVQCSTYKKEQLFLKNVLWSAENLLDQGFSSTNLLK